MHITTLIINENVPRNQKPWYFILARSLQLTEPKVRLYYYLRKFTDLSHVPSISGVNLGWNLGGRGSGSKKFLFSKANSAQFPLKNSTFPGKFPKNFAFFRQLKKCPFSRQKLFIYRGVQYVHWVMHKCIMVKVGGNEMHVKYVKAGEFV